MRILITGGAGFIGSHLVEYYHDRAEVRVLDNLRTGYRRNLTGLAAQFIEGDILDRDAVEQAVQGVDVVFHLAAMISVPESMTMPIECNAINTVGLLNVLEAAVAAGVTKLVFSSSAAIYGDDPAVPKTEDMTPRPKSPYAITKLDGEHYCQMFHREGRIKTACLRYFNVFGPRQHPGSAYAAAIPIFITNALAHQPLTIFGDGGQTRDFVYAMDIATANAFMAENDSVSGVFNVGYGRATTIRDIAERIIRATNSRSTIEYAPPRSGDVCHSQASIAKITESGFRPTIGFDTGLELTIASFRHRAGTCRPKDDR